MTPGLGGMSCVEKLLLLLSMMYHSCSEDATVGSVTKTELVIEVLTQQPEAIVSTLRICEVAGCSW